MRNKLLILAVALGIFALAPAALLGGKPPRPAPANPEVVFRETEIKLSVCDADGGHKTAIHIDRDRALRSPQMAPDRRSVVFVASWPGQPTEVLRTHFTVVEGAVQVGNTETIVGFPFDVTEIRLSPSGDRFAYMVDGAIWELEICSPLPCDAAAARPIYTPPPDRWAQPLGGYSANGMAFFFEESGLSEPDLQIRRIDLTTGETDTVLFLPGPAIAQGIDPSPIGDGGLDSRLVLDIGDHLYVLDTATGQLPSEPLAEGHAASWGPDESAVIAVKSFRYPNSAFGPLMKIDTATGVATQIIKYGGSPDWAPPLR